MPNGIPPFRDTSFRDTSFCHTSRCVVSGYVISRYVISWYFALRHYTPFRGVLIYSTSASYLAHISSNHVQFNISSNHVHFIWNHYYDRLFINFYPSFAQINHCIILFCNEFISNKLLTLFFITSQYSNIINDLLITISRKCTIFYPI